MAIWNTWGRSEKRARWDDPNWSDHHVSDHFSKFMCKIIDPKAEGLEKYTWSPNLTIAMVPTWPNWKLWALWGRSEGGQRESGPHREACKPLGLTWWCQACLVVRAWFSGLDGMDGVGMKSYYWHWHLPGDSKWPFYPLVGGQINLWNGHLTIPKKVTKDCQVVIYMGVYGCQMTSSSFSLCFLDSEILIEPAMLLWPHTWSHNSLQWGWLEHDYSCILPFR